MDAEDKGSGLVDPIDGALDQNNTEVVEKPTSGPPLEADVVASSPRVHVVAQGRVKRDLSPSLKGKTHNFSDRLSVN